MADKVYDATTTAVVTVNLAGVIAGDTVTATAPGTFSDKNVGVDKAVTIGAIVLGGADAENYIASAAAETTADITAAALTSSAAVADKVYDAATTADLTLNLMGVIAGDAVTATAPGAFSDKNVGVDKAVTVGTVVLAGADAGNYIASAADTTADIAAAALTSSATAADKVYDATTTAELTVSLSGVIPGDSVTAIAPGIFNDKNAGVDKTVTVGTIVLAGADAGNYIASAAADTIADITAAALTSSATAADKVYDATATADMTLNLAGIIAGDAVTATAPGTFNDKNVGVDKAVTVGTIVLVGADAGNYTAAAATDTTADITAAALTSSATATDKVYDATTTANLTISLAGVIADDTVTATAPGTFNDKNVSVDKAVTVGAIVLAGTDAGNYTVAAADTTADVTVAALTSSATAADKVYDGTTAADVTVVLTGVIAGDSVTATASGAFNDENVGVAKTVTIGTIVLGGADARNYTASTAAETTADIVVSPGLIILESDNSTVVNETGATDAFSVALTRQPAADVIIAITSADTGEVAAIQKNTDVYK